MKIAVLTAALALVLACPAAALALGEEAFGNAPRTKQPEWAVGILEVVNLRSRVYTQWVNGNESFYYKGDANALNEAIVKFAAVKDDQRRLVLLPGAGKTRSFGGKEIEFTWQLHVPSGIYRAVSREKHAVMTVYLPDPKPRGRVDRKQVQKWIGLLDDDSFEIRRSATQELEKLGRDVKPLLREALRNRPTLEMRDRIQGLLSRLRSLDASDLEIPRGVTMVSPDDLLEAHLKSLKDANAMVVALAAQRLSALAPFSDKVVPALTGLLKKENKAYVRRVSAGCLGQLGADARPALPALKEGLDDSDANVRAAFQAALSRIEKAKPMPVSREEVQKRLAILKDIAERKKAAGEK